MVGIEAQPARSKAQPARSEAQPARPKAQLVRPKAQPARPEAQPTRPEEQPARRAHTHRRTHRHIHTNTHTHTHTYPQPLTPPLIHKYFSCHRIIVCAPCNLFSSAVVSRIYLSMFVRDESEMLLFIGTASLLIFINVHLLYIWISIISLLSTHCKSKRLLYSIQFFLYQLGTSRKGQCLI